MTTNWGTRLVALAAVLVATPATAEMNCYRPQWQRFADPRLGVALEVSTDVHQSYTLDGEKFVNIETRERARPGEKIDGRCSSFNFNVVDFGNNSIAGSPTDRL